MRILRVLRYFLRYGGLGVLAVLYEAFGHRVEGSTIVCGGSGCAGPRYTVVIEHYAGKRLVGRLTVYTCYRHDIGA